jgi:hypothetical protein
MTSDKTLYEQAIAFFQNNPVIAGLILLAVIVTGAAAFTNALKDLQKFIKRILDPSTVAGTLDKPIRLSPEQIKKLLIGKIEQGKIVIPTLAEEGNENTWYDAYYFSDGTMLYRRANAKDAYEWVWYIDKNGNLCRGVAGNCTCRTIESIGDNHYRAVGFKTGTIRYTFSTKHGIPDNLK